MQSRNTEKEVVAFMPDLICWIFVTRKLHHLKKHTHTKKKFKLTTNAEGEFSLPALDETIRK